MTSSQTTCINLARRGPFACCQRTGSYCLTSDCPTARSLARREVLLYLLSLIQAKEKQAFIVVAKSVKGETEDAPLRNTLPGVPTLHDFYPRRYASTIIHMGYGLFEGRTEDGPFYFDGGVAMKMACWGRGDTYDWISWSPLRCTSETLKRLGYDFDAVEDALMAALEASP